MPDLAPDCYLSYTINHEAWYWDAVADRYGNQHSVMVHSTSTGGGVDWEFSIEEVDLGSVRAVRAGIFDDAFKAFTQVPELFARLASEAPKDVAGVVAILDQLGAVDVTERVSPYATNTGEEQP